MSPVGGTVEDFDEAVGLGTVVTIAGERFRFHCTQIADGTRTIEPGTQVTFVPRPARLGALEAFGLRPART